MSLRAFLGTLLDESTPDHSTLTSTRNRLPQEGFDEVFPVRAHNRRDKKLLDGKTVGVDSTTLEANAAMKSSVRRDTGEDWKQYVTRSMKEDGTIAADQEPPTKRFAAMTRSVKTSVSAMTSGSRPPTRQATSRR